ncbi:hypothetical protein [Synoicihabitans lomoniglobus]|uniref:Uncharacterized protein n=1 Tax=Synoicihabitans lomoniglobus TaxID=2909285 RepID=A0AAE9ZWT8_9BACT|nr:hypothetical protein [Opitutaceae bacterium LMO-M01]WED64644.1 hypothetical protein PXH66_20060 [Opitutaceae bacterium LMO-M01]
MKNKIISLVFILIITILIVISLTPNFGGVTHGQEAVKSNSTANKSLHAKPSPAPAASEALKKPITEYQNEKKKTETQSITIDYSSNPTQLRLALCKKRSLYALGLTEAKEDQLLLIWMDFEAQIVNEEVRGSPAELEQQFKAAVTEHFSDKIYERLKTVMSLYPAEIVLIDMWDVLASEGAPLSPNETLELMEANQKALSSRGDKMPYPKIPASLEGLSESEVRDLNEEMKPYEEHKSLFNRDFNTNFYNLARQVIGNARVELVLENKDTPPPSP